MLVLSILHSIFLTPEEIDTLLEKQEIETIGVSVPVWYYEGDTSEPAEEVFCKYKITYKADKKESITVLKTGYAINLPVLPEDYTDNDLTNEQMSHMTTNEINQWYDEHPLMPNIKDLKTEKGRIGFKQFIKKKQKNKMTNLIHTVELAKMEKLTDSLTYF